MPERRNGIAKLVLIVVLVLAVQLSEVLSVRVIPALSVSPANGAVIDPPAKIEDTRVIVVWDIRPDNTTRLADIEKIENEKDEEATTSRDTAFVAVQLDSCEISFTVLGSTTCINSSSSVNVSISTKSLLATMTVDIPESIVTNLIKGGRKATVAFSAGAFLLEPGRQHTAAITWSFATEEIPVIPTDAVTSSSSLEVKEVSLFGIGIFVGDLAAIDLKQGTFYADLQVYLLRYFRTFRTQGAALSEATIETPYGRQCREEPTEGDSHSGGSSKHQYDSHHRRHRESSKWLYLANVTLSSLEDQKVVQFVNIAKSPKITVKPRASSAAQFMGDGGVQAGLLGTSFLDHFRVQSEFYFAAALKQYPFQTQTLPIIVEMISDSAQADASTLLCTLPRCE